VKPPSALTRLRCGKRSDDAPPRDDEQLYPTAAAPDLLAKGSVLSKARKIENSSNLPASVEQALKRALLNSGIYYRQCTLNLDSVGEKELRVLALLTDGKVRGLKDRESEAFKTLLFDIRRGRGTVSVFAYPADSSSLWPRGKGFCSHNSSSGYAKAIAQALDNLLMILSAGTAHT
jgi:hypothetical protein